MTRSTTRLQILVILVLVLTTALAYGGLADSYSILGNVALARQDAGVGSPAQVSLLEIDKAARRARESRGPSFL